MNVLEKELTVKNRKGIHGRVAAAMIMLATRHKVRFCIKFNGHHFECSSVLDILGIALVEGATFIVQLEGEEAAGAMADMEQLVCQRDD